MRALILHEPGRVTVESVPDPVAASDELMLRIRRVGLCGSDLNSYRGKNPMIAYPRILGHEVAATVVAAGSDHPQFPEGTDVTLSPYTQCGKCPSCLRNRPNACQFNETMGVQRDGGLCEFIVTRPEKLYAANLGLRELCLVEPLTVGFHAVARGRVTREDTVAILGCGGVGLGAVAAAAFRGAKTIAVDVGEDKLNIAAQAGATATINTMRESMHDRLQELTGGRGPDVVIEAIGSPPTFRAAVEEVAFTGRVVYIGYAKEPVAYETRLFVQKELDILGSRNALPEDFRQVIQMLEHGRFPVDAAISHEVTLSEAPRLLEAWSETPSAYSKIIINLDR